ncbi:MAG: trypsin-like peptidase domain-containing protein [Pirellulales bacterium]
MDGRCSYRWAWRVTLALAVTASGLFGSSVCAADDPAALGGAMGQLAQRAMASTVGIYCEKDEYASYFGTGAVVTPDGYILTSTTVVPAGAEKIEVYFADYVKRAGTIVETSEPLETTLIKVEGQDLPYLPLAPELPTVGTRAFTTSNANNVLRISGKASFSKGHISGLYEVKNLGGESLYAGLAIETTAAVNPGSDGGPIMNERGQLCGVISLNVSASRWQGVGVPTKEILARLETFKTEKVKPLVEPFLPTPIADASTTALAASARDWSQWIVGLKVERKYPAEFLPRTPWETFMPTVKDWKDKKRDEQRTILGSYFEVARLLEVNQMLRRPADPVTGVVVSPDGHILTSAFNLGDDLVFLAKKTGEPHRIEFKGTPAEVSKEPEEGWSPPVPNPITKITVLLADGSTREAKLVARHAPLGVALLKVDGPSLPAANLAASTAAPVLGEAVGMLGFADGPGSRYTLNEGIVSAPSRNRGLQFQTDAMLNYGNSGGPVLSTSGKLLGIATTPIEPRTIQGRLFQDRDLNTWQIAPNSGVGMIAWSEKIRDAFEDLKAGKSTIVLPGPFLGVSPDPLRAFGTEVVLGQVGRGTPAEKAGLRRGDQILEVNGEEVSEWKDLTAHLEQFKPGDSVKLKVRRPGINKHLLIKGKKVSNEAELQELLKSLDGAGKLEAEVVMEDVKVVEAVLGERQQ